MKVKPSSTLLPLWICPKSRPEIGTIALCVLVTLAASGQDVTLPDAVRRQTDAAHPGWKLAGVIPEVESEIRERTPRWPPNLILGDFDGNQQTDIAMLVQYPEPGVPGGRAVLLLAYLGDGQGFTKFVLERAAPHDPRQFLHLVRAPREGDAIGVEYEAVGGHAWTYRNGHWQSNPTQR